MISPAFENAYREDEIIRGKRDMDKFLRNEYWRKRILDIEEWGLKDYDRPIKYILKKQVPIKERIIKIAKLFIP